MKRFLIYLSFTLLFLLGSSGQIQAVTPPAVTTIDTTPYWNGVWVVVPFGYSEVATFGQVVTVPVTGDNVLQSFSFYMNLPNTCTFRGYVYAWDGAKAMGSALYESPTRATKGSGNSEEVHFETGGIALTPGAQYVLFASTSKDTGSGYGSWGYTGDVYPGSGNNFVYIFSGTNPSLWTSMSWSSIGNLDAAFKATFVKPARKILYWIDMVWPGTTDYMGEALANVANTYSASITTAAGLNDFETKVAAGGWDLVVLMIQEFTLHTPNFNTYVSKGGKAIFTDWKKDPIRGALFGVSYTGNDNQDVITIMDDLLLDGVTNPMSLTNPGWNTFSMGMAGTTGIVAATFPNRDAAIVVGANGKTIINGFLTDTATSASDGVALFENEILSLLPLTVTSAIGGERVPAGGTFNLTWIPGTALGYSVYYSINGGLTWKLLARQYGNAFEWSVPFQNGNQPNCLVRVVGYGPNGVTVSQDKSDRVFSIEVVKQILPNGGETWTSGNQYRILWTTNGTMGTVANVHLFYSVNGGTTWKTINTLTGNPGAYLWTVPTVGTASMKKCKVMVVLKNATGTTLGSDVSDGFFTINP